MFGRVLFEFATVSVGNFTGHARAVNSYCFLLVKLFYADIVPKFYLPYPFFPHVFFLNLRRISV